MDKSTVSAATDVAFGFGDPLQQIVDINFQSGPDARLAARLLLYSAAYHHRYPVPVRSTVILLRPAADHSRLTGHLTYQAAGSGVEFTYEVLRLWQQSLELFLGGGLALLPLAPLCQLPPEVPVAEALRQVIHRVDQRLVSEAPYARAVQLMTAAFVLTGMRADPATLEDIFRGVRVMIESSAFELFEQRGWKKGLQEGLKEGLQEGQVEEARRLLLRWGGKRFGEADDSVKNAIVAMNDLDRLERMLDVVSTLSSWEAVLAVP